MATLIALVRILSRSRENEKNVATEEALMFNSRLPPLQIEILDGVYKYCYGSNARFKEIIDRLFLEHLCKIEGDLEKFKSGKARLEDAAERDESLSTMCRKLINLEAYENVESGQKIHLDKPFEDISFQTDGYLPEYDIHLVFTPWGALDKDDE